MIKLKTTAATRSALAAAAFFSAPAALASPTVYQGFDDNPAGSGGLLANPNASAAAAQFNAALSGVGTESFESFTTGTSAPLSLSFVGSSGAIGATLTGDGNINRATRAAPASGDVYAVDGAAFFQVNGAAFGVSFDLPVAAFGVFLTDMEAPDRIQATITHSGGGTTVFSLGDIYGQYPEPGFLSSGSVHFLGFIDNANPFASISFSGIGFGGDQIGFDQLTIGDIGQIAGVPEPSAWALLILGFGTIGAGMRTRRRPALAFA